MVVIDGKDAILGRLATSVAKKLIAGETVSVINASKIIITGDPETTKEKYLARRARGSPQHGPFFPKRPETIVRRAVRGMIPYKATKGRAAFKKLRIYSGMPKDIGNAEAFGTRPVKGKLVTVGELAKSLGWDGNE